MLESTYQVTSGKDFPNEVYTIVMLRPVNRQSTVNVSLNVNVPSHGHGQVSLPRYKNPAFVQPVHLSPSFQNMSLTRKSPHLVLSLMQNHGFKYGQSIRPCSSCKLLLVIDPYLFRVLTSSSRLVRLLELVLIYLSTRLIHSRLVFSLSKVSVLPVDSEGSMLGLAQRLLEPPLEQLSSS